MLSARRLVLAFILFVLPVASCAPASESGTNATTASRYEDLLALFKEWRTFQQPKRVSGVPDYSASAMAAQQQELAAYQRRLAGIDPSAWPIPHQVDYHVV